MRPRLGIWIAGAVALLIVAGAIWKHLGSTGGRPVAYRVVDVGHVELGAPIGKRIRLQRTLDLILGSRRFVIPQGSETVLISPGPRSSSGYAVRVLSVTDERRRIVVRVRERTPELETRVRAAVTYPYRLIVIPLSPKPVRVQWEGR